MRQKTEDRKKKTDERRQKTDGRRIGKNRKGDGS